MPAGRALALVDAAEASRQAGQLARSRAEFTEAAEVAAAEEDGRALALAALGVGGIWVYEQRDFLQRAALEALWRRARASVADGSLVAARLDVRTAAEAVYEGGPVAAVRDAAAVVLAFGDDAASAEALSLLHHVQLGPGHARSRVGMAEEIVRLAARAGDPLLGLMGLCWRTVDLFLVGDRHAEQSHQELRERAEAAGCEAIAFVADVVAAMCLARRGRLADAEAAAATALDRGTAAGDPDAPAYFGAMLAALRWWQGRAAEVIELVRAVSASPRLGPNDHVYVAADALLSATLGDVDAAEEALARLAGIGLGALPDSSSWLATQFLAGEAAFLLGDTGVAAEVRSLVEPFAELPVLPSLAVVCLGSARRTLGLAAATAGDLDAAVAHLEAAIREDRRLGSRPMAALTEHALAAVLGARGAVSDSARAEELRGRAAASAARMGVALPAPPAWLTGVRPTPRVAGLRRVSGGWWVEVGDRAVLVGDLVGMAYLATLVRAPSEDHDVLQLAAWTSSPVRTTSDPVLDRQALASYRLRARELTALLADHGLEPGRAASARRELADLTATLRGAIERSGAVRAFPTDHERARTAVRKAIVRAVETIAAAAPELGVHLRDSLTTGAVCRYDPGPGWTLSVR
jgi:tetratricopeptide (TPR) repeat protein